MGLSSFIRAGQYKSPLRVVAGILLRIHFSNGPHAMCHSANRTWPADPRQPETQIAFHESVCDAQLGRHGAVAFESSAFGVP